MLLTNLKAVRRLLDRAPAVYFNLRSPRPGVFRVDIPYIVTPHPELLAFVDLPRFTILSTSPSAWTFFGEPCWVVTFSITAISYWEKLLCDLFEHPPSPNSCHWDLLPPR